MQAVCGELVSADFPVMQGKNREFSRVPPPEGLNQVRNILESCHFLAQFPTKWNREIFRANRELIQRNREFSAGIREALEYQVGSEIQDVTRTVLTGAIRYHADRCDNTRNLTQVPKPLGVDMTRREHVLSDPGSSIPTRLERSCRDNENTSQMIKLAVAQMR